MATIHVRNVPDDLYARLQALAQERNLSMSAAVIQLLEQSLKDQKTGPQKKTRDQQIKILADIRRHRFTPPADMPDSTALLREDRER